MKTYGRVEVYLYVFLTSALGGGEWSNVKMDLKEIKYEDVNWIHLAQIETSGGLL
jgi:hypothetical protein